MITLTHRRTLRIVIRDVRLRFIDFDAREGIESEGSGVLRDPFETECLAVDAVRIRRQSMADLGEEEVAGVLDTIDDVLLPMLLRVDPASDVRYDVLVDTGTVDDGREVDDALFHRRDRGDRLEGRTRCELGLGCVVEERQGQVLVHLREVITVRDPVVVEAWIGHEGPDLSGLHIRHDDRAIARIQRELCRGQCNLPDLLHEEGVGIVRVAGRKLQVGLCILRENALLKERHQ